MANLRKKDKSFLILKEYNGENPYLIWLKNEVYNKNNTGIITDFQVEYILENYNYVPKTINKIATLCDWYAEKKQEEWKTDFVPNKIKIISIIGETTDYYHCYIQYRQSVPPIKIFLPKKAVLKNFFVEDYNKMVVDFDRYDRLSMSKDKNRRLKDVQKTAVKFLLNRKKCVLADDMGMGKTTSLSVAAIEGNFDCVLIICPASIKTNWKNELSWYIPEKDISIIESFNIMNKSELERFLGYSEGKSNKNREELLNEAKECGKWQNNRFVIVNFDILDEFYTFPVTWSKDNIEKAYENSSILKFIKDKKSLIIIDEAHRLSNKDSNRYRIIRDLVKRGTPDSLFLATGTPVTNNPQNLFCLLQLLGDPITNDWNYYATRYCNAMKIPAKGEKAKWEEIFLKKKKKTWFQLTPKEKDELKEFISNNARKITITTGASNLDELKERISHLYLRRVKEDLDGMAEKEVHVAYYDLNDEQKLEYERLWDEYEELKKTENPDVEINKELLEGAVYRKYISNIMLPYTQRIVNHWTKKGEKVIIACCYDEELYSLRDIYKDNAVIYNGKMNPKQKDKAVDEFINNPDVKIFIGNIQAAGVGINLTVSNKLVFNNMSFVPGDNQQMEDRVCRIGQKKKCDIYYQIFRDTQYEKMWDSVLNKDNVIRQVIKKEEDKTNAKH